MPFDFGNVVLVPFPFTSQTASKKRPAVIVSGSAYNRVKPDIVVMAITSQFRPVQTLGEAWLSDWRAAGLLKPSVVKPVFVTLEQRLVLRTLGSLSAIDVAAVRKSISDTLG
ncbi:MAG: type II toxin-antitoxin system PemK/MazF family toxin [Roseiarcus sp.]